MTKDKNSEINNLDQTPKILIVDDTPADAAALCEVLEGSGYQIIITEDGETALQQAERFSPDLILLDILLPGIDGFETCRRLKKDKRTQDIPIIFSTALDDPSDIAQGFDVGGVDYVTKPLRYQEVLARINNQLTIRKLQKEVLTQNKRLQEKNTRQRWAQEALKESRERYRLLAEHATDIISRQTPEGVYLYVSPACKTILGYEIEEMVGQSVYDFVHPQEVAEVKDAADSVQERPDVLAQIYRTRRKDGSYV